MEDRMRHFFPYLGMVALLLLCYWQMFSRQIKAWTKARWKSVTGIAELETRLSATRRCLDLYVSENVKLRYLLRTAALRTAPTTIAELMGGLNAAQSTGNVCYIHPDALRKIGAPFSLPRIVCTELMPISGVIYAPAHCDFFVAHGPA